MTRDELVAAVARATRADLYDEQAAPENASEVMQAYYRVIVDKHEALMKNALSAVSAAGVALIEAEELAELRRLAWIGDAAESAGYDE